MCDPAKNLVINFFLINSDRVGNMEVMGLREIYITVYIASSIEKLS